MNFKLICNVDDCDPSLVLVRLNDDFVLRWLKNKVEKLKNHFMETVPPVSQSRSEHVTSSDNGASVCGFVSLTPVSQSTLEREKQQFEKECQRRALQLVVDYLPPLRWRDALVESYGLTLKSVLSSATVSQQALLEVVPEEESKQANKQTTWEEENGYVNMTAQSEHLKYTRPAAIKKDDSFTGGGNNPPPSKKLKESSVPQSNALRKLAKTNVSNIPQISTFFQKKV